MQVDFVHFSQRDRLDKQIVEKKTESQNCKWLEKNTVILAQVYFLWKELEPNMCSEIDKSFNLPPTAAKYLGEGAFWQEHQVSVLYCVFYSHYVLCSGGKYLTTGWACSFAPLL